VPIEANLLGVTKASLHYHFAGKAELGEALITRYARRFDAALAAVDDGGGDVRAKLDAYAALYADALRTKRRVSAACWRPSTARCQSRCKRP
jgi:TetR/AcrR family transcriptional repressor of nem operon